MGIVHRLRAVLGLKKKNYPNLHARGWAVYNGILGNPALFAGLLGLLPALLILLQAFDQANQLAGTHAAGSAEARDLKAGELITSLETLRAAVQALVDASPEQGALLIAAAAMLVGQVTAYTKPFLQAKQPKPSGPVLIIAHVGLLTAATKGKVFFNWQFSSDGKTWVSAPSTPHGNTVVTGLTPLTTYSFRVSVNDVNGPGEWTDAVTLLVR